jgi:hypothetical protein
MIVNAALLPTVPTSLLLSMTTHKTLEALLERIFGAHSRTLA